jgi:hypothetical protein
VFITVARSSLHGNGCFTTRAFAAGEVVSTARILVFPPEETELLLRTSLKNYLFYLRDGPAEDGPFHAALAMAPISFCNHSAEPNCDYALDAAAAEIVITARRPLARNEEITIDYGDYAGEII